MEEKRESILLVDDNPISIRMASHLLSEKADYNVSVATSGEEALEIVPLISPDLILLDIMMPGLDGYEICRQLKSEPSYQDIPIIFMSALQDSFDVVKGFEAGAVDYIRKPIQPEEFLARIQTHIRLRNLQRQLKEMNKILEQDGRQLLWELTVSNEGLRAMIGEQKRSKEALERAYREIKELTNRLEADNVYLREEIGKTYDFENFIGESEAIQYVFFRIKQVAATDSIVLIQGETGTGKELVARAIHSKSARKDRPLVKVNCAALSPSIIESELFGHEKGAYTGAHSRREGRFELGHRGTLFLDEIAELPPNVQAKLLRVLEDGEFERLGSSHPIRADVRLIAATNRNLEERIKNGLFREDLHYRLNVFPITVPGLRERKEDIPILVDYFVKEFSKKIGKPIDAVAAETMDKLMGYAWPGNVRELKNLMEREVIGSTGRILKLRERLKNQNHSPPENSEVIRPLWEMEKEYILKVLERTRWRIEGRCGAAELLELNPSTLRGRMRKYRISRT